MNRRALLKAAPALALVGAVPAVAATSADRMADLYKKWLAAKETYNDPAGQDDDEETKQMWKQLCDIEDEILSIHPQTTRDYAFKIIVLNDFAVLEGLPWGDAMLAEARALIGA